MSAIEVVCTITAKGQTTVPKAIRQALGVGFGGHIAFRVEDGTVSVHAVTGSEQDPALAPFLALLEHDFAARPEVLAPLTPELAARMTEATKGVDVDPDVPIEGEVAL
jgi:antitoxin PrlF